MKRWAVASMAIQLLVSGVNTGIAPSIVWAESKQDAINSGLENIKEQCPESLGWMGHRATAIEILEVQQAARP